MINNMNQEEPQVKNFFQEHGMEFSFGIWHALFAFICFWSGFLFGISEHILLGLLGALIYFVSYYVIFQYTISGTFRSVFYRKNREEGSKKARSILSFSQFFYCTFPFLLSSIIGTMTVHGEKNLFTGCLIFLDVCLFFYDFYTGLSSGFKEKILAQAESDLLKNFEKTRDTFTFSDARFQIGDVVFFEKKIDFSMKCMPDEVSLQCLQEFVENQIPVTIVDVYSFTDGEHVYDVQAGDGRIFKKIGEGFLRKAEECSYNRE